MPDTAINMNTEKEWFDHPSRATELRTLIHDPTFIDALDVLTAIGLVPVKPEPGTTASLMEFYALSNRWRDGYLECLANIKILAKPKLIKPRDETSWKSSSEQYEKAKKEAESPEPINVKFE